MKCIGCGHVLGEVETIIRRKGKIATRKKEIVHFKGWAYNYGETCHCGCTKPEAKGKKEE